jgi:hypothetical protein
MIAAWNVVAEVVAASGVAKSMLPNKPGGVVA